MKTKKYQGDDERAILTGMIVNDRVLGRIVSGLKSEKKPFRSKWSNEIFRWCVDFFTKYSKAPRGSIQVLFRDYASKESNEDVVGLVEKFISSLSDDYKAASREINEDHLVDLASRYFGEIRFTRLKDSLEAGLLRRDLDKVREDLATFNPVSFAASATVDVFTDSAAWKDALVIREDDVLIQYPNALGGFFGNHLQREGFISLMAPEKRGKTFWLLDMAWRASAQQKRRTLFFEAGDMSKRQMMQRFIIRALRRPIAAGTVVIPKRIRKPEGGEAVVKTESKTYENRVTVNESKTAKQRLVARTASSTSLLKMGWAPISTAKVSDIRLEIDEQIKHGWIPDVIVIDYADILAPETGTSGLDFRHQTNETWKALRRLSQDYHCLVITATQSDARSYDGKLLTMSNFSEDKRKLSHVTGVVGLNQSPEEKKNGIYRLNWVVLREGVYLEQNCITVAGCLGIANPAMISTW